MLMNSVPVFILAEVKLRIILVSAADGSAERSGCDCSKEAVKCHVCS